MNAPRTPSGPIIAPSILAADFTQLGQQIQLVSNADWIHVDVMDGHFVPNLSFGADIAQAASRATELPLDLHLMIDNPEQWVDQYITAGASCIIFHVEATSDPAGLARKIREQGCKAGFSLRPGTPIESYLDLVEAVDLVLVMSVEPGFGGQKFMPEQLDKVRTLRTLIDDHSLSTLIEIDGGINTDTIGMAAAAGADAFVAGSAVFSAADPAAAVEDLRTKAVAQ